MKRQNLWTILIAFLFGQLIQLVTVALSHYLYVSDPVMVCIAVAVMTTALVIITAVFTLMDTTVINAAHAPMHPRQNTASIIPPIFMDKRKPFDIDAEDIDEIDKNTTKETE